MTAIDPPPGHVRRWGGKAGISGEDGDWTEAVSVPLFWRIFLLNAVVLIGATALLLGPVTVSTPVLLTEAAVLTGGLAAMLIANGLLRIGLAPLQRLTRAMTTTDLLRPGLVRPSAVTARSQN